jgi:FtsH-binding integral membrane protein
MIMSLIKRRIFMTLFVLFSVVGGAAVARFDLATDTRMIAVLFIGIIAMIVAVRQQKTIEN